MYESLISSAVVPAGGSTQILFSNIPQTYTDLMVVLSGRSSGPYAYATVRFNGSATSDYRRNHFFASGSGGWVGQTTTSPANSITLSMLLARSDSGSVNNFSNSELYLTNYSGTLEKNGLGINANTKMTDGIVSLSAVNKATSAAITSITITSQSGNLAESTTAYLYGITKGTGGATVSSS